MLIQDVHLLEKLAHFDRERIPERVVHAKGAGAFGYFEVTHDVTKYTRAKFLSEVGKRTEVFARFSTVGGEKGSADSERDPRGFALKFYTEEGNYDMVGNNTPVFFIRDTLKFPDFIHTQKRNPATNLKDPDMFWDFLSLTPESIHQVTILFSDRGTPQDLSPHERIQQPHLHVVQQERRVLLGPMHFKTEQGIQNFTRRGSGADARHRPRLRHPRPARRNRARRFPVLAARSPDHDPGAGQELPLRPLRHHQGLAARRLPAHEVGRLVLNRNPENYFAEVEQAAFSPGNFVPGIGPPRTRCCKGGSSATTTPTGTGSAPTITCCRSTRRRPAPCSNYQRDGAMRSDNNGGGAPNYWPNSFGGPAPDPEVAPPPIDVAGMAARHAYELGDVDFVQAGDLYRKVMTEEDREHLVGNIVAHLRNAQKRIQLRQTALFYKADAEYGERVAKGLQLDLEEVKRLAAMSQEERVKATAE